MKPAKKLVFRAALTALWVSLSAVALACGLARASATPLWHVVDSSTDPAQRPEILTGQRSLWCGTYDAGWGQANNVGYPNCAFQVLYLDTGAHAGSNYDLTLSMNVSVEWLYDYLYLVGGGYGSADPLGANPALFSQAVTAGSVPNGSGGIAFRLVAWSGSIQATTPGATHISPGGSGTVFIQPVTNSTTQPTTVNTTISLPSFDRGLYFMLVADQLFSTQDGIWPAGHGVVLDNIATSDNGVLYDEQTAAGGVDSYGGLVLVGTPAAPVISARTIDQIPGVALTALNLVVQVGGTAIIRATGYDPDCVQPIDALTADLSELPAGNDATLTPLTPPDPNTKRVEFRWHPTLSDVGTYHVRFTASNTLSGSATATIRVIATGTITGLVTGTCNGTTTPLLGATVDVFAVGSGALLRSGATDASGRYTLSGVPATDCIVSLATPLGYTAASPEVRVTVTAGGTTTVDYGLSCVISAGNPRSSGYWKHQYGQAASGELDYQSPEVLALCSNLDLIEEHFNSNALNQVVIYNAPKGASCADKLAIADGLLNLGGSPEPIDKARQQLFALLLNVATNNLGLNDGISKDGATTSQAITYCDNLIDFHETDQDLILAAAIAEKINSGQKVNAGVIPLTTTQIAYRDAKALSTFRVTPNPGPGVRTFRFEMGKAGWTRLKVYDVSGRLVKSLVNGQLPQGEQTVRWSVVGPEGHAPASGIYFAKLETNVGSRTIKVVFAR